MDIKSKQLSIYCYHMGEYVILCNDTPFIKIDRNSFSIRGHKRKLFENNYALKLIDSRSRNSLIIEGDEKSGQINTSDLEKIMTFILTNKVTTIKIINKENE